MFNHDRNPFYEVKKNPKKKSTALAAVAAAGAFFGMERAPAAQTEKTSANIEDPWKELVVSPEETKIRELLIKYPTEIDMVVRLRAKKDLTEREQKVMVESKKKADAWCQSVLNTAGTEDEARKIMDKYFPLFVDRYGVSHIRPTAAYFIGFLAEKREIGAGGQWSPKPIEVSRPSDETAATGEKADGGE